MGAVFYGLATCFRHWVAPRASIYLIVSLRSLASIPIHSTMRRYSHPLPTHSRTHTLLSLGLSADLCFPIPPPLFWSIVFFCLDARTLEYSTWTAATPERVNFRGVFLLGIRYRYRVYWSGRSEKMGTKQHESGLLSSRLGFLAISTKIHLLVSSCFDFG